MITVADSEYAFSVNAFCNEWSGDEISTLDGPALNRAAWDAVRNSPVLMAEARGWIEDCEGSYNGLTELTGLQVLGAVSRNYAGGIVQFYMDTRGLIPVTTINNKEVN